MKEHAHNQKVLRECETKILEELEKAEDDILANEGLIKVLADTKEKAKELEQKLAETKQLSAEISVERDS